jgi:hypothetical protein
LNTKHDEKKSKGKINNLRVNKQLNTMDVDKKTNKHIKLRENTCSISSFSKNKKLKNTIVFLRECKLRLNEK